MADLFGDADEVVPKWRTLYCNEAMLAFLLRCHVYVEAVDKHEVGGHVFWEVLYIA